MMPKLICQSCTMPIDNVADAGTEKDGSKSTAYCKYCYQHGALVNPDMTLPQMEEFITTQMKKMNLPESIIHNSLSILPRLKRWQKEKV